MTILDWLLDSDPAIRWQVLRDLVRAPTEEIATERARLSTEGWSARLLGLRDEDGQWCGGACFPSRSIPARADLNPDSPGQPWISTLPSLDLLRIFGLDPDSGVARETVAGVAARCRWEHEGQAYFDGEVEACINGRTVAQGAYFGQDVDGLAARLLEEQLADGGWNCWTE